MQLTDPRSQMAYLQFQEHFLEGTGVPTVVVNATDWQEQLGDSTDNFGPTGPCGWAWPLYNDAEGIMVAFCPTLIATAASDLDDEDYKHYLGIAMMILDLHIAYWDQEDPWKRHKKIMDEFKEKWDGSLEIVQRVQLNAYS